MASRIRELRVQRAMTQQQLAELVEVDTSTISRLETGKRGRGKGGKGGPSFNTIKKIADVFGLEPQEVVDPETLNAAFASAGDVVPTRVRPHIIPPAENAAESMVPVRGVAAGSHVKGAFQLTSEEIDFVPAPPALSRERNLFAIYVVGDSMEPEHREGALRFASPGRPARIGDTVIIEAQDDPDEPEWAMIGHLEARGEEIVIGKLNPKDAVRIPRLAVKRMHKVLDQNELFGR